MSRRSPGTGTGRAPQRRELPPGHLHDPAAPPPPLAEGDGEAGRLLVIIDSLRHPPDPEARPGALGGKLRVLGDGPGVPASQPVQGLPAEGEAGADELGAEAAGHPGPVPDEVEDGVVQAVAPRHAGGGGIGRPGPGLAHHGPGAEGVVHPGQVVRRQGVVRVQHQHGVKVASPPELVQGLMEGVPLPLDRPQAAEDLRPRRRRGGLGAVGTVVGDHIHPAHIRGVVLAQHAADQVSDHRLLVPGGGDHREAKCRGGVGIAPLPPEGEHRHSGKVQGKQLEGKAQKQQRRIQQFQYVHGVSSRRSVKGSKGGEGLG